MSTNFDNRKRAFADVVAIDAWHSPFDEQTAVVDLHVDVVFGTARVGGEEESPVRFRLSVKRAEIVLIIPESEPVGIDRSSVSRDSPELPAKLTEVIEQSALAHAKGAAAGSIGAAGITGSLTAEVGGQANVSSTSKYEVSGIVEFMFVTQSITADGYYRWAVEPKRSGVLQGRPWNAVNKPRLKLIDKRRDRTKRIPPTVRVEVRCRREDLAVDDVEVKDETLWEKIKSKPFFGNKMAAAESYIRDRLAEEGFAIKNINDIFTEITLGSATAAST
jgi:hypothetical protein